MNMKRTFLTILILLLATFLLLWACSEKKENLVTKSSSESGTMEKSKQPPPPPPEGDEEFVEYDIAPVPVGGYEAITKHLKYPELARKAGIQGRVLVAVKLDKEGDVIDTNIKESLGPNGCDEAAMNAIKSVKWKPAMKDNKPVDFCWVYVPIEFKLK